MNRKDEMFNDFDIDLETANRIAKEYPPLSDSARERMFNMTRSCLKNKTCIKNLKMIK